MSKAIYITYRNNISDLHSEKVITKIKEIEKRIIPDHIIPNNLIAIKNDNTFIGVFNPVSSLQIVKNSLCMGFVSNELWWSFDEKYCTLEGTYAIFRNVSTRHQILTDLVGSRSIWYYFDEDKFIASTSQLAIIYYLESFEFNKKVVPWMLSSGTLGPFLSWDTRIKALKPNSCLTLTEDIWKVDTKSKKTEFIPITSDVDYEIQLREALSQTFNKSKIDLKEWVLPLSGGYDSRGILLYLRQNFIDKIKSITWGIESSQYQKNNDAHIAKQLANHFDLDHKYLITNQSNENIEEVLKRFLINGEGRIDHISGYMDGFNIWKTLHDNNYEGIIRGDEGFGWHNVWSEEQARIAVGMTLFDDFQNLKSIKDKLGIQQDVPSYYERLEEESLAQWRDRLYHTYRLPIILAALNDLKLTYVEVVNPLLFARILKVVYGMPDNLRTDKKLFKKIVKDLLPEIPFARSGANASLTEILRSQEMVRCLKEGVMKENSVFPVEFINDIVSNLKVETKSTTIGFKSKLKKIANKLLPRALKQYLISNSKHLNNLDPNILAFRVFIVLKINDLINENIQSIKSSPK